MDSFSIVNLKFQIVLEMVNKRTGAIDTLIKDMYRPSVHVTDVKRFIEKIDLEDCFKREIDEYLLTYNILISDIEIYSYEIKHDFKEIDIFFEANMSEIFDISPCLFVVYNPLSKDPILTGTQINNNSVLWRWEYEGEFYSEVINFHFENVISQLPIGINYFTESGLEIGETITRYVVVNNGGGSKKSNPVSITIKEMDKKDDLFIFEEEKRDESTLPINTKKLSRLRAFKSGVGDFDDLKILPPEDFSYDREFKVLTEVYGTRTKRQEQFKEVPFSYRYAMRGGRDYEGFTGSIIVSLSYKEIQNMDGTGPDPGTKYVHAESRVFYFDDESFVANVYVRDFFDSFVEKNKLIDYKDHRFEYEMRIDVLVGEFKIYCQPLGMAEYIGRGNPRIINSTIRGFRDAMFRIVARHTTRSEEVVEYYPPLHEEPKYAVVNGDFEVTKHGYREFKENAHMFTVDADAKDVEFWVDIEHDVLNENSYIQHSFKNGTGEKLSSTVNGDEVTFKYTHMILDTYDEEIFLTQKEEGHFTIKSDEQLRLNLEIDISGYDKEELNDFFPKVSISRDDIVIEHQDVTYDNETLFVNLTLRSVINPVSRWSPKIHSGYYYLNNEERFLYADCVKDLEEIEKYSITESEEVKIKLLIEYVGKIGRRHYQTFSLDTREKLLNDNKRFTLEYESEIVFDEDLDKEVTRNFYILRPKAIPIGDVFVNYDPLYVYESEILICERTPTEFLGASWREWTRCGAKVRAFIVSYDDKVGVWHSPVEIFSGELNDDVILARISKIRFEIEFIQNPELKEQVVELTCEKMFKDHMNHFLSNNVDLYSSRIQATSHWVPSRYVSRVYDIGPDFVGDKGVTFEISNFDSDMKLFIQESDNLDDVLSRYNLDEFRAIQNKTFTRTKRFFKFKVEFKNNKVIPRIVLRVRRNFYNMDNPTVSHPYQDYTAGISDIEVNYFDDGIMKRDIMELVVSHDMKYNNEPQMVIGNLSAFIDSAGKDLGFDTLDIRYFHISKVSKNNLYFNTYHELYMHDMFVSNTPLYVIPLATKTTEYDKDPTFEGRKYFSADNTITLDTMPKLMSPVIVCLEDASRLSQIPFKRVYSKEIKKERYTLETIEEMPTSKFTKYYLKNFDIDPDSVRVYVDNWLHFGYKIYDNILELDYPVAEGLTLSIRYKVFNSFILNYDEAKDTGVIELHPRTPYNGHFRVFYEQEEETFERELHHLSLNPIQNPIHSGFVYMSDETQEPQELIITPTCKEIYANGLNQMEVIVMVLDKNKNPIPKVLVNSVVALGLIDSSEKETDENGIAVYTYTSYSDNAVDVFKSAVTDHLGAEAKIINVKVGG